MLRPESLIASEAATVAHQLKAPHIGGVATSKDFQLTLGAAKAPKAISTAIIMILHIGTSETHSAESVIFAPSPDPSETPVHSGLGVSGQNHGLCPRLKKQQNCWGQRH